MSADVRWPAGGDPPRDPALVRLLGELVGPAPLSPAESDRLHEAVMAAVRGEVARGAGRPPAWWEVAARWVPAAAAAGLAAVLLSGAVVLAAAPSGDIADDAEAPPETAAVAQVLARYPGDAVLATLLSGGDPDDLSTWSAP